MEFFVSKSPRIYIKKFNNILVHLALRVSIKLFSIQTKKSLSKNFPQRSLNSLSLTLLCGDTKSFWNNLIYTKKNLTSQEIFVHRSLDSRDKFFPPLCIRKSFKYLLKSIIKSLDGPAVVRINLFVRSIATISDIKMVSRLGAFLSHN